MRVYIAKSLRNGQRATFRFVFELEKDDKRQAKSFNSGKNEIFLGPTNCTFDFPFDVAIPHPDLVCMAALKIISPYIGSRVMMQEPVSESFGAMVKKIYPHIVEINTCERVPRKSCGEKYAISFSGGADSIAVANVCPPGMPLILSARKYHPEVGEFEKWYTTKGNETVLEHMADSDVKICVKSDFDYLSTNHKFCIYPDRYAFTIPCILLADHLGLTGIFTGDTAIFGKNPKSPFSMRGFYLMKPYYAAVGLDFDAPTKGVTEIGTEMINEHYGNAIDANTCQYGDFRKPCMKCIKCFRKTLIRHYILGKQCTPDMLKKFDECPAVVQQAKNADKLPSRLAGTYAAILENVDTDMYPNIDTIKKWAMKRFHNKTVLLSQLCEAPYRGDTGQTMQYCLGELKKIFSVVSAADEKKLV